MLYPISSPHSTKVSPSFSDPYWLYNKASDSLWNWWLGSQKADRIFQDNLKGDAISSPSNVARASRNHRSSSTRENLSTSGLPKRKVTIGASLPTPKEEPSFIWTALDAPIYAAQHLLTCVLEERGVMNKSLCLAGFDPVIIKEQFQLIKIFSVLGLIWYFTSNQEQKSSRGYPITHVEAPLIYRNRRYS